MGCSKKKVYVVDTSAILTGKPLDFDAYFVTTPSVDAELSEGGRDYRNLQFLKEKGLRVSSPTKEAVKRVRSVAEETGDLVRLSDADIELLALAVDEEKRVDAVTILTDDYSIQNVAFSLGIPFESISEKGITKKFIWRYMCVGCKRKYKEHIKTCPICGKEVKTIVQHATDVDHQGD